MAPKRKREETQAAPPAVIRPKAGTRAFATGKAVKDGLATGSPQAFVSFRQQIVTPHSQLPLPLTHPTVVILQHYLDVSPTGDEIFRAWHVGDQTKSEQQVHAAVELLSEIINILTPIPFFRSSVVGLVNKIVSNTESYHDFINYLIQSPKRDDTYHGLLLASSALAVDPPSPPSSSSSGGGRLGMKVWNVLVEGGSVRGLGKLMGMRRRNKDGMVGYGGKDPYDKPDIRHLILKLILPLLPTPSFTPHAKTLLPALYSNLETDPPITVLRILTAIWSAINGPSPGQNRKVSLVVLQEKSIEALLGLLGKEDVEETSGKTVGDLASAFLEGVTTVPGRGICFQDSGYYSRPLSSNPDATPKDQNQNDLWRQGLHNRILGNVVRKVGTRVLEEGLLANWMVRLFENVPELVAGYWPHSSLSLEPRLSTRWTMTLAHIGRIISLPPPPISSFRQPSPSGASDLIIAPYRAEPPESSVVIESILPALLTKGWLTKGLGHAEGLVQHMTALTLARALKKLEQVQIIYKAVEFELHGANASDNPWLRGRQSLELEVRKRFPDLSVIVSFAQKSATLTPPDFEPESESDFALVARSAMLTELALRIFGLVGRTLPGMAGEMKFDPGRLLVSSSSTKSQKRLERSAQRGTATARAGSPASDAGSVQSVASVTSVASVASIGSVASVGSVGSLGSVGSAGTVGMGGGFGSSRGDVRGWEALSQVHVLGLLSEGAWDWSKKAAGSPYTYIYHILLLHVTTPLSLTHSKTTSLLTSLLSTSLLFSHDVPELAIWLNALPRSIGAGPMLLAQQIQLLSFLDDCFRRCLKTPYRYLEILPSLFPTWTSSSSEMPSPLLTAILEQLSAKTSGQLISTEAACIIVNYLRRVILGLVGKQQANLDGLEGVVSRLEEMAGNAKEKGQVRAGFEEAIRQIRDELALVASRPVSVTQEDVPQLIDEPDWSSRSFEAQALSGLPSSLSTLITNTTDQGASVLRHVRFLLHLHILDKSSTSPLRTDASLKTTVSALGQCLKIASKSDVKWEGEVKRTIFTDPGVRALLISPNENLADSQVLIKHLSVGKAVDEEIAQVYLDGFVEALGKKGKSLPEADVLSPWITFLPPLQAITITKSLLSAPSSASQPVLTEIVIKTQSPKFAMDNLGKLLKTGVIGSIVILLDNATKDRQGAQELQQLSVKPETVGKLFHSEDVRASDLLARLVRSSPAAAKIIFEATKTELKQKSEKMLPVLEELVDLEFEFEQDQVDELVSLSLAALTSKSGKSEESAINLICYFSRSHASIISGHVAKLQLPAFNDRIALLAARLSPEIEFEAELAAPAAHLISLGLQYAARISSDIGEMTLDKKTALSSLAQAISATDRDRFELQVIVVEPVITAVIQDRLDVSEAVGLATLLAGRVELKASFLRQQLQALLATPSYAHSTNSSCPPLLRLSFIRLLHALFISSPYVSCQPAFIEPLVMLYRGTMSEADRRVLNMTQVFEAYRRISVGSLWRFWNATGIVNQGNKILDALTSLDPVKVFSTCQNFPLRRPLRGWGKPAVNDIAEKGEEIYDPVFIMGLLVQSMQEGMRGLDWVETLRSNVLGVVICALSSRDKEVRSVANYALSKVMSLIETTGFYERSQLFYQLRLLRHSLSTSTTRLPTLTTLFFAHALRALATPSHFLYPLSSRHLLQRPVFDIEDTPMLYGMLYANEEGWKRERGWMIRFLRDGVRSECDWRVIKRRKVWTLLATMFTESLDPAFRRSVLQTMSSFLDIPAAASSLVLGDGLFTWIDMQSTTISSYHASLPASSRSGAKGQRSQAWERDEQDLLLAMAEKACAVMSRDEKKRVGEGKELRGWVKQVEVLVKTLLQDTDAGRLENVVRMLFSFAQVPGATTSDLFTLLVTKLESLETTAPTRDITAHLFHIGLALNGEDRTAVKAASEVAWRVERGDAGRELGDWFRKEKISTRLQG